MANLYKKIEDLCEAKGISVGRMCSEIGIHRSVLGNLSSGKSKTLSTKTLHLISSFFNVQIEYFLDLGEPDPSDIPPEPPVSKHQILFALFGDVADEITDAEYAEVQRYCDMVRLRKLEEKRSKNESN